MSGTNGTKGTATSEPGAVTRSTAVMAAGTIAPRLLGFVRSYVLALVLGVGLLGDVFGVANVLPNIIYLLLAGGVINSVFVPQLVRAQREDPDGGAAYSDRLLTASGIGLLVISVLATAAAPLLIAAYGGRWTPDQRHVGLLMALWCLPQIFFYGAYTMLGQVSNARGRFGPMMWAPLANNIVVIAVVGLFALRVHGIDTNDPSTMSGAGIAVIAGVSTLGVAVQALVLLPSLRSAGYRYRPRLDLRGSGLGVAVTLARWTLAFVAVNQVAYFLVLKVASDANARLAELAKHAGTAGTADTAGTAVVHGGNAAYQNAYLFFILPHSIITVSLVTALLPSMSAAAHAGRRHEVRRQVSEGLRSVGALLVPVSLLLVVIGPTLNEAVWQGRELTAADGRYIGQLLALFALGLVPFSVQHMLLRSFYAYEDTRTPFFLTSVVAGTNTVLALGIWATVPVEHRTQALAGAYAASYWVGMIVTAIVAGNRLRGRGEGVVRTYVRAGIAAALAAVPAGLVVVVAGRLGHGRLLDLAAVVLASLLMAGGYLALAQRMQLRELHDLRQGLTGRLRRA